MNGENEHKTDPMLIILFVVLLSSVVTKMPLMITTGPRIPETTRTATSSSIELSDYEKRDAASRGISEDLYKIFTRHLEDIE